MSQFGHRRTFADVHAKSALHLKSGHSIIVHYANSLFSEPKFTSYPVAAPLRRLRCKNLDRPNEIPRTRIVRTLAVELTDLLLDGLARLEQRPDRSHQFGEGGTYGAVSYTHLRA